MKRLLLLTTAFCFSGILFAQYAGTPFTGTSWQFGMDSLANFSVGQELEWKNGNYHGIPHYAYDVGIVDTLRLPSDDLAGTLVAGSGYANSTQGPPKEGDPRWRTEQADSFAVTLDPSDIASQQSLNFGGHFTTHNNRAVADGTAGWYRYTCDFAQGNYKVVIRGWGAVKSGHGFWIRFYDKATMDPVYPWTRIHPGSGAGNTTDMENAVYCDVLTDSLYVKELDEKWPTASDWIETTDEFSLSGPVVFEYTNIGPTTGHDVDVTGSGAAFWGEVTFMYQGEQADKYAPVVEVYKTRYDDMDECTLSLSENGILYLVPPGTAIEEAETANIGKIPMTSTDSYPVDLTLFNTPDTIQLITMDAAGNSRITAPIAIVKAFSADKTQGVTGDTIFVNTTREGYVALVPATVTGDRNAIDLAIAFGNADTLNVDGGNDTLVITNLMGDMDCNLYLVDVVNDMVSYPLAFQLGEGSGSSDINEDLQKLVSVSAFRDEIIVRNTADFDDIRVFDVLGKEYIGRSVNSNVVNLDASGMQGGVYILRLTGYSGVVTKKFYLSK